MERTVEHAVIGRLLTNWDYVEDAYSELSPMMFSDGLLGRIYEIILQAYDNGEKISVAGIQKILGDSRNAPEVVYEELLRDCIMADDDPAAFNVNVRIVKKSYQVNKLRKILSEVKPGIETIDEDISSTIMQLENINSEKSNKLRSLADISKEYAGTYFTKKDHSKMIRLPFDCLNEKIGSLEGGDLIVIGARPSVGKSALVAQMALFMASQGKKVGFYSLEMKDKQLFERFTAMISGIRMDRIRSAEMFNTEEEQISYQNSMNIMSGLDNLFLQEGSKSVSEIRHESRHMNYDVIIVDYLQLLQTEGTYSGNRYAEVGEISHKLKAMSMEFDIPVIALSQLNRVSAGKEFTKPSMSEMRESGDIEQDASIIILLWNKSNDGLKGCAVEKNRQGKLGESDLRYDGSKMRFCEEDGYAPIGVDEGFLPIEEDEPMEWEV